MRFPPLHCDFRCRHAECSTLCPDATAAGHAPISHILDLALLVISQALALRQPAVVQDRSYLPLAPLCRAHSSTCAHPSTAAPAILTSPPLFAHADRSLSASWPRWCTRVELQRRSCSQRIAPRHLAEGRPQLPRRWAMVCRCGSDPRAAHWRCIAIRSHGCHRR